MNCNLCHKNPKMRCTFNCIVQEKADTGVWRTKIETFEKKIIRLVCDNCYTMKEFHMTESNGQWYDIFVPMMTEQEILQ